MDRNNRRNTIEEYIRSRQRKGRRARVFSVLSVFIALSVVLNLMEPASTMSAKTYCGLEEHVHSAECYAAAPVCGQEEGEAHSHTADCYEIACVCGMTEHRHTADCFTESAADYIEIERVDESAEERGELDLDTAGDENAAEGLEADVMQEVASDAAISDEAREPLEAVIYTESEECLPGQAVEFELGHFGGVEPVRYAVAVTQNDRGLFESEDAPWTVSVIPEAQEEASTLTATLTVTDGLGDTATQTLALACAPVDAPKDAEPIEEEEQPAADGEEEIAAEEEVVEDEESVEDEEIVEDEESVEDEETVEEEEPVEDEETVDEENSIEDEEIVVDEDSVEDIDIAEDEDAAEDEAPADQEPGALTFESDEFALRLNYGADAGIPEDAQLTVRAIEPGDALYAAYAEIALDALTPAPADAEADAVEARDAGNEASIDAATEVTEETEALEVLEALEVPEAEEAEDDAEEPVEWEIKDARFFTVAIELDGEALVPQGEVEAEVTYYNVDAERAVFFRIGDAFERVAYDGAAIYPDYVGEVLGYAVVGEIEAVREVILGDEAGEEPEIEAEAGPVFEAGALNYQGADFAVALNYDADAEIPADAALDVREILPDTEEYALYSGQADAALNEDWNQAAARPRFFDITILYEGAEIQPAAPVSVRISFDEAVSVPDDDIDVEDVKAIHFADEGAQLLDAESAVPEAAAEAVSFDAESFSVYGIVPTATITSKVITAEGETFDITVTYGRDAEIPEGARLEAEEITAGSDPETYETYTALSAAALTGDPEAALALARLFDIRIVVGEGVKVEPEAKVSVRLAYAGQDGEADRGDDVVVVHFAEAETQVIAPEATTDESGMDVVSFETESFSLYTVVKLEDIPAANDPLSLHGKSFAIVTKYNSGNYPVALTATESESGNGTRLNGRSMTSLNGTVYSEADYGVTQWTFAYNGNNTYSVYTIVDGQAKYLSFAESSINICNLSLSDEPQELTVIKNEQDQYQIKYGKYKLNLDNGELNKGYLGWDGTDGQNPVNDSGTYMKLCTYAPTVIQSDTAFAIVDIQYAPPVALQAGRPEGVVVGDNQNNAAAKAVTMTGFDRFVPDAGVTMWYLDKLENEDEYLLRTIVDGVTCYFSYNEGVMNLTYDINQAAQCVLKNDNGDYNIGVPNTRENGKTGYFNLFSGNANRGFNLWDDGNKLRLSLPSTLDLNGVEAAIISTYGQYALVANGDTAGASRENLRVDLEARTYIDKLNEDGTSAYGISTWRFDKNADGTYKISTLVGGERKYLKLVVPENGGEGTQALVNENEASDFSVYETRNGGIALHVGNRYLLRWGNKIKNEIRYNGPYQGDNWTSGESMDRFVLCTPVVSQAETYGIACVKNYEDADQKYGNSMLRLAHKGDDKLESAKSFVWKDDDGYIKYFNSTGNNELVNETEWPAEFVLEKANNNNQYYIYGYDVGVGMAYLRIDGNRVTTGSRQEFIDNLNAFLITVEETTTSNGETAYCLHNGNTYLSLMNDGGFGGSAFEDSDAQKFMFVRRSDKNPPKPTFIHTGTKVGVTQIVNEEFNPDNDLEVLIYRTVYDNANHEYLTYAIDGDGSLIPAYDHGDDITLYAKQENSAWWTVQIDKNGYVNFYNKVTENYICPQADGEIVVSGEAPGVQLRSKIDRQNQEFVAHNAAIIKWEGESYYGLKVGDGVFGTEVVTPTAFEEFSFASRFALSDEFPHKVETVSNTDIKVTMYDFAAIPDSHGHSTAAINNTIGFAGYTNGNTATNSDGKAIVSPTLTFTNGDGKWPTSAITNDSNQTGVSLSELFKDGTVVNNTMFLKSIYDATGYYEYSSFDNFAHLDGDSFEVYREIGTPYYGSDNFFFNRGNFMPYNTLARDSYSTNVNQFDENGNQIKLSDPTLGKELYTFAQESNYYFGMTIDVPFQQPKDGVLYNGEQIVLEFNGDDDLWVYIDDTLVLDIGGDHDAISGSINFTTGEVVVKSTNFNSVYADQLADGRLTIREMFDRAGRDVSTGFKDNGTFADYTTHTLRLFYMERGAAASNLHIKFNLQTVTPGALTLKKELDEEMQMKYGPAQEFYFQVYDENDNVITADRITDDENHGVGVYLKSAKIKTASVTPETKTINGREYPNVFTLKANEELILTSWNVEDEFYFKEITNGLYTVKIDGVDTRPENADEYIYKSNNYKANGSKATYLNTNLKAQLQIKKEMKEALPDWIDAPGFEFKVELTDASEGYIDYADGPYGLMNAERQYLIKGSEETSDTYVDYDNTSATGKISGVKAGQTIVIDNLLPSTGFRVTEVTDNMPAGYGVDSYSVDDKNEVIVTTGNEKANGVIICGEVGTTVCLVTVKNKLDTVDLKLAKVSSVDNDKRLQGAEFSLYHSDGTMDDDGTLRFDLILKDGKAKVFATNESGEIAFNGLPVSRYYKLKETKAPDGYNLPSSPIYFKVDTDGTVHICDEKGNTEDIVNDLATVTNGDGASSESHVLTVENTPGVRLPATGGRGTALNTLIGGILLLGAALLLIKRYSDER